VRVPLLVVVVCAVAVGPARAEAPAPPPPPAPASTRPPSRCERAVVAEAAQVGARIRALAAEAARPGALDPAARARMLDEIIAVVLDVPDAEMTAASLRLRVLLDARDQLAAGGHDADARARIARVLDALAADFTQIGMARPQAWTARCGSHPDWDQAGPSIRRTAAQRAIASWLRGAYRRAQACNRLVQRVRRLPQPARWKSRGVVNVCYRDLSAASARCSRDVTPAVGAAGFRIVRAAAAVDRLHALRPTAITPAELAVLRARIGPALAHLPPALAGLPAAASARRALGRARAAHPWPALDQVAADLRALLDPCSALAPSFSARCVTMPELCRPMEPMLNETL
jgi:hypothetical protein